ncbi:type VII secretion integral membrane protein EccD [Lentzea sp. NBRC 102530]|nr:type VII secretion integral membrane protein EccD [Lentzea sp. NBRC 102530]
MSVSAELCRVTVVGPDGRADLAVPTSTTVSALLPTLMRHVVRDGDGDGPAGGSVDGSWVLQRLGDAPFAADGTPETLDWLDGELLYLSPAADPLPELDFDDVAEGMATAVNRQGDRWNEKANRRLFLSLASAALGAIAVSLFENESASVASATSGVIGITLLVAAVLVARTIGDRALAAVLGVGGTIFAGLAGTFLAAGVVGAIALQPSGVLVGGGVLAGASFALLALQRLVARTLPIVPFGATAMAGVAVIAAVTLSLGTDLSGTQTAIIVMSVCYVLLLFSPKLATRAARLRGPQLPRTAEELKVDVEPMPAAQLIEQTGIADSYLSVLAIGSSVVFAAGFPYLMAEQTWVAHTVGALFAALVLLRSREFLNVGQRTAFALAGTWGAVLPALTMLSGMNDMSRLLGVLGMAAAVLLLVSAALRPAHRRMLPIWPHMGDVVENLTCIALVPLILHLLGVFAWARGLAG